MQQPEPLPVAAKAADPSACYAVLRHLLVRIERVAPLTLCAMAGHPEPCVFYGSLEKRLTVFLHNYNGERYRRSSVCSAPLLRQPT